MNGDVNLNEGNVVFAFINGFVPKDFNTLFDVILAESITIGSAVDIYYNFLLADPWGMNASEYLLWEGFANSGLEVKVAGRSGGQSLTAQYAPVVVTRTSAPQQAPVTGPNQTITPLAIPVPGPAPLLLLSAGLLALGLSARRRFS